MMDKGSIGRLSGVAELLHEQNTGRLKQAKRKLELALQKREDLLKRRGRAIDPDDGDPALFVAQTMWGNSTEAAMPSLDAEIQHWQEEVAAALAVTRASYTRVSGLDRLAERVQTQHATELDKREELAREAIVRLKARPNPR